ncbi:MULTISPECIES: PilZ domain-containing protein [Gammaproteobacteria]|uniref:PilZ domain-containing protein n=1 Tax=Gammaproteobacteria TaxID=1236 RepID=UPI000DCFA07E|nr:MULTISPECIES: PilZ domain-containing protein [Gammaproteobacteria]RTE86016.1 PilZ domain-containing protein [Aliidiomarina sp. B3213]TCZ91370.1 PilZ domain-containing protein [Lysobacter sp. N42]
MDNSAREQLIEQLKPVVNEPEFDQIFAMLTADLSGPERFRLKSELRRLAAACNAQIDLRKRVVGDVRAYTHKGQVHYMDPVAIAIFEDGLERYQGVFTQDTYDRIYAAENNLRVIAEKEKQQRLEAKRRGESLTPGQSHAEQVHQNIADLKHEQSIEVPFFTFGKYTHRNEERMNYAAAVTLKWRNAEIPAVTADVSVSGIRVKLKVPSEHLERYPIKTEDSVDVSFTGFSSEFTLNIKGGVPYSVIAVEQKDNGTYLRLKRDTEMHFDDFDSFLSKFIDGYKRRYKVNVDNVVDALTSKAHEQLYLPRMVGVPLFFKRVEKRMFPQVALETKFNAEVLDSWTDENNNCVVGGLFSGKRLAKLLKQLKDNPKGMTDVIIYTFQVLRKGSVYFYSATQDELKSEELRHTFLGYACRKNHFKVYRFSLTRLDLGKAWIPSTLPKDVAEKEGMIQRPPTPVVMKELEGLTHVGVLTDITPSPKSYADYVPNKDKLHLLNDFVHPRRGLAPLKRASFDFINVRKESRFNYRSQVRVVFEGESQIGMTRDFSTHGLQIEVERPIDLHEGDIVHIDFPVLGKHFPEYELKKLPYRVMNLSPDLTIIHMAIVEELDEHVGRQFFDFMIRANRKSLKAHQQSGTVHGLQLCLRNLYCNALMSLPLFLKKPKGQKFSMHRAGVSPLKEPLKLSCKELSEGYNLNLQPLLSESFIQKYLAPTWLGMEENSAPWTCTTLVRRSIEDGELRTRRLMLSAQIDSEKVCEFIQKGLDEGEIYALRYTLVHTGQPDTEFIANEFRYLYQYSPHRADALEEEMWSVVGLVDVTPVTGEILMRYGFSEQIG